MVNVKFQDISVQIGQLFSKLNSDFNAFRIPTDLKYTFLYGQGDDAYLFVEDPLLKRDTQTIYPDVNTFDLGTGLISSKTGYFARLDLTFTDGLTTDDYFYFGSGWGGIETTRAFLLADLFANRFSYLMGPKLGLPIVARSTNMEWGQIVPNFLNDLERKILFYESMTRTLK